MEMECDCLANLHLRRIFNNPKHSDLTINFEDRTFDAHKIILSLRTQFFDNATDPRSNFVESNGVVTIQDHCADSIYCFLKWCYTGTYDITTLDTNKFPNPADALRFCRVAFGGLVSLWLPWVDYY
jgi:hypothetical protein